MPDTPAAGASGTDLSVVVTIVDGGAVLAECLEALAKQRDPPFMEVVVPYDDSVPGVEALVESFPYVRFLAMGPVPTERAVRSPGGQHELYDRRRSAGLDAATGSVVCILEDRGVPEPDWAGTVWRLHGELSHAVIGGAVECGIDAPLNWAVFFCDYGRYQRPFAAGPRPYVTDVNVSYKREALFRHRALWIDRYHETTVHWQLAADGETLFLTPDLVVHQRRAGLRVASIVRERIEWGRLFAYTRVRDASMVHRVALSVAAPLIPVVLLLRQARLQVAKRARLGRFLRASPMVAVFLAAWGLGELIGYVTARP